MFSLTRFLLNENQTMNMMAHNKCLCSYLCKHTAKCEFYTSHIANSLSFYYNSKVMPWKWIFLLFRVHSVVQMLTRSFKLWKIPYDKDEKNGGAVKKFNALIFTPSCSYFYCFVDFILSQATWSAISFN